jgi:sacsin
MIPWVGIAACIPTQHPHLSKGSNAALLAANGQDAAVDGDSHEEHTPGQVAPESAPEGDGQAFCFLPLPIKTGLPVHVNAFFELSSNRRDIW